MSTPRPERRGSFFKLIESLACELVTLKKEMGHKSKSADADFNHFNNSNGSEDPGSVDEDVSGLFLRGAPCWGAGPGLRDSGYSGYSPHRRITLLERLVRTHSVWLQLGLSQQGALTLLQKQPPRSFVVRRSASRRRKVISVRMDSDGAAPVRDFTVTESQFSFALDGSGLRFADLFRLVAFCCISRDVLPFKLRLPAPITAAQSESDLDRINEQGAGFWDASAGNKNSSSFSNRKFVKSAPQLQPHIRTRPPSQLERCQSNGALCFVNPLFAKVHHEDARREDANVRREDCGVSSVAEERREDCGVSSVAEERREGCGVSSVAEERREGCGVSSVAEERRKDCSVSSVAEVRRDASKPECPATELQSEDTEEKHEESLVNPGKADSQRSPPPRPPPPRVPNRPLLRTRSMPVKQPVKVPVKVPWIVAPKSNEGDGKGGTFLSRLGSSLSISPSTSPPTKIFSISSPIAIPKASPPKKIFNISSPLAVPKAAPVPLSSCSQEDEQMEEHVIERALRQARLQRSVRNNEEDGEFQDGGRARETLEGEQRLSDMSLSTDSSDSLDFSQPSGFFFPPLHDPATPTLDEMDAHLPLSLPPLSLPPSFSLEEEDEDEDDEEDDDGVSLSDQEQDQDMTLTPPGQSARRRSSAGAVVIHKALKGKLRKMSGVFQSLLTPEKRAVRRLLELSRDKNSYFGGLVQDFISYVTDRGAEPGASRGAESGAESGAETGAETERSVGGGLGLDSGTELLQTVRQFLTQMKSYLQQSSELQPPLESLIPDEQTERVLEKAMHKLVLKPLKHVLTLALHEASVRSGAWAELRENLHLAKTKTPVEMGVSDAAPPDHVSLEKIRTKLLSISKLYSPEKKVQRLLQVCKLIYAVMEDNSGRLFGADDFLPMLTYVLAQCDMPELDHEVLYMMELLDPTLLNGEGGYYLTSVYGALSLIKNVREEQAERVLSSQTRDTLHQWHRRRTMQRTAPSIDDFQNYLRVALQERDSGCTAKTLRVRPQATVEDVCSLCALKFCVDEPQEYGLFLETDGGRQQLAPDTHPQKIKAELHSRERPAAFHFVYRRVDFSSSTNHTNNRANSHSNNDSNPDPPSSDRPNLRPRFSLLSGNVLSVSI